VETHSDPRWENRTWITVKIMDIKEKTIRQLAGKTRYMSASISPDGNYIAVTENTIDNRNNLLILDAWNGFIQFRLQGMHHCKDLNGMLPGKHYLLFI
jgi:hypothetical protein